MRAASSENEAPQLSGEAVAGAKACTRLLAEAGISRTPDGGFAISDSLGFRSTIERSTRQAAAKDELMTALSDSWADPTELRLALQPTRADTGAGVGEGVKDSLVRLLLHCQTIQSEVATILIEMLPEHQTEIDNASASHVQMPLPRLILSQFRWLEVVVNGSELLESISQMLQAPWSPLSTNTSVEPV